MATHVLVLGAGASKHYNFPLAREIAYNASQKQWSVERLATLGIPQATAESFSDALRSSLSTSIDDFLSYETDAGVVATGKAILASYISDWEVRQNLTGLSRPHWYEALATRLIVPDLSLFPRRNIGIVTFNYDRSLERCLLDALINRFKSRYSIPDIVKAFKRLSIVHIYGQLGILPELTDDESLRREYEPIASKNSMDRAVAAMRLLPEVTEFGKNGTNIEEAERLIAEARNITFLGFAYSADNLKALGFKPGASERKIFSGTIKGFESDEQREELDTRLRSYGVSMNSEWATDVASAIFENPTTILGPALDSRILTGLGST